MKRILLFASLVIMFGAACKKEKKEPPICINTIVGTWAISIVSTEMVPLYFTFRPNRSFFSTFAGRENSGVYQVNTTDSSKIFELILTGTMPWDTILTEITSHNEIKFFRDKTMVDWSPGVRVR